MKRRIHIDELKLGMRVVELDRPWLDSPFLFQGFTVNTVDELNQVRQLCEYVFIEDDAPVAEAAGSRAHSNPGARIEVRADPVAGAGGEAVALEQELDTARGVYKSALEGVRVMARDLRSGRMFSSETVRRTVEGIVSSVLRNSSALLWFAQLQSREGYAALHAINVAVYAVALGRHLGLPEPALVELGVGALLHDVGKLKLPPALLAKTGRLSAAERQALERHPVLGFRLLEHAPDIPRSALLVALQHHEACDGSGYPRGISAGRIHEYARIVAVVDRYDNLTSDRPQRDGVSPQSAVKTLYELRGRVLDEGLVDAFIQFLGLYPVGSLVELSSGEVGIVIGSNPRQRLRPKVLIVMNERKERALPMRIVDLQRTRRLHGGGAYDIRRALDPHSYGMDLNPYIKGYKARSLSAA